MILLSTALLSAAPTLEPEQEAKVYSLPSHTSPAMARTFHHLSEELLYCGAGVLFGCTSLASEASSYGSFFFPKGCISRKELHLFSQLCAKLSQRSLSHVFNHSPFESLQRPSHRSWTLNQLRLAEIPPSSNQDQVLLSFLEDRWLAKSCGFLPFAVDWVYPCFGIKPQVHPETTGSYARNPYLTGFSKTYKNKMDAWKQTLPHPYEFPLILTRPYDLSSYLPPLVKVAPGDDVGSIVCKAANHPTEKVFLDVSDLFTQQDKAAWITEWATWKQALLDTCKNQGLNPHRLVCIEQIQTGSIGGIRELPLEKPGSDLELISRLSTFGLLANRIELDRSFPSLLSSFPTQSSFPVPLSYKPLASFLSTASKQVSLYPPHEQLMVQGTLQILIDLLDRIPSNLWEEASVSPTKSKIVSVAFFEIEQKLKEAVFPKKPLSFFETTSLLEEVHAHLSSLLEILSPFQAEDFSQIYAKALTAIPPPLKPLASFALHTSAMASLGGILKAAETSLGKTPHVLYGENIYYECIHAAQTLSECRPISEASEEDLQQADVLLAQFNPALKNIEQPIVGYEDENIRQQIASILPLRKGKPLTVAIDCTLDWINPPKLSDLLETFSKEIQEGSLNIACYKSGLKFDLFGMDNYCGAPFFMVHNTSSHWDAFESLIQDPALQTDLLSANWFCLAYQSSVPFLEAYRKQIFSSTRKLLEKAPPRMLYDPKASYRVAPMGPSIDPCFIDIKVSGPLHQLRAAALAAGKLYLDCMENGHPIFHRVTLGLYHPNFTMIFGKNQSTLRLTLGLDPSQIAVLAKSLESIDALNDP